MQNRKTFRIILAAACFIFAGVTAYEIIRGDYEKIDLFILGALLFFGIMYIIVFLKDRKNS